MYDIFIVTYMPSPDLRKYQQCLGLAKPFCKGLQSNTRKGALSDAISAVDISRISRKFETL